MLLVDDEVRLLAALRRGLTAEGFAVSTAENGLEGLQLARFGDFDAVVLDVMLPGLSGYEVVRRLRAEDNWVPVLMLSAKDGEYDQADALDEGADDYLTKPFSFVVLLARLRALLRRAVVARPAVLTVGRLRLDPSSREVFLGEDRVVFGSDAVWYGSPQWQIEALWRFEIPEDLRQIYGYPKLTKADKAKIFGLNAARLYNVDVKAKRNAIPGDRLENAKMAYLADGGQRQNAAYGWVRAED